MLLHLRVYPGRAAEFLTADCRRVFARKGVGELKASAARETNVPYLNELRPAARNAHMHGEAIELDPNW